MQPYSKGQRQPGAALSAMLRGGPSYLPNPADATRQAQRKGRKRRPKKPTKYDARPWLPGAPKLT